MQNHQINCPIKQDQKDIQKLNQKDHQIVNSDPFEKFYKGIIQIQGKDYDSGIQSLQQAKALLQIKMDDEEGFVTGAKLNRIQVDQCKEKQQTNNQKQSDIQNKMEPQKMSNLNLRNNSEVKKVSAIQFKKLNNSKKDYQNMHMQIKNVNCRQKDGQQN